jgi:hypothetical protein
MTSTSEDVLLDDLKALADELGHAPSTRDVDKYSDRGSSTYRKRFPTYTTALARAGLMPKDWHPLTDDGIHRFNRAATSNRPRDTLPALFFQFLPVQGPVYMDFNPEWITTLADDHILRVPPEFSPNTEKLEIKIPSTWSNPYTGNEEQTQLPSLFDWWLTNHDSTPHASKNGLHRTLQKIAADADLTHRPMVTGSRGRTVPRVAPKDLRHTHGIHLARNGASGEWIARRMGLDRPEQAEVYFALLEHHDRY